MRPSQLEANNVETPEMSQWRPSCGARRNLHDEESVHAAAEDRRRSVHVSAATCETPEMSQSRPHMGLEGVRGSSTSTEDRRDLRVKNEDRSTDEGFVEQSTYPEVSSSTNG